MLLSLIQITNILIAQQMDCHNVQDLSKSIVRQFLYQNKYLATYQAFEREDLKSNDKISKSTIIKSLCLEHLVFANKKSANPLRSLLEVLISYLNNKYITNRNDNSTKVETLCKAQSITSEKLSVQDLTNSQTKVVQHSTRLRPGSARRPLAHQKPQTIDVSPTKGLTPLNFDLTKSNQEPTAQNNKAKENERVTQALCKTLQQSSNPKQQQKKEKMISMFGKKKQDSSNNQPQKPHPIFTNLTQSVHIAVKYEYKPMDFGQFTLQNQIKRELTYKKVEANPKTKKKVKAITQDCSSQLRKILFQGQAKTLPKAWKQGILLSPYESTFYGLQQIEGGPCGIIAALQCYYLKHILHLCPDKQYSQQVKEACVVAAIADMLYAINSSRVILAIPSVSNISSKDPISIESVQIVTLNDPKNLTEVYELVYSYKAEYMGQYNSGYTLLLYSCILTKGTDQIASEMDSAEASLIGNHGHCNQQLVNLFITGRATTNIFDGVKTFGEAADKIQLKGTKEQSQFGFLTIFQTLNYVEAGYNLKCPVFPIWVICKEFHYHVVFGEHYLISQNSNVQKFDLVYFDGLYNCADRIVLTLGQVQKGEGLEKISNLPLIQQVLLTKWGRRDVDWNGSIKIL